MADKFRKVKHTSVIIGREFWGFWMAGRMGRVAGIRTGFRHLRRTVYLGVGASGMGPGHPAVAVVGRNAHPASGSGGKRVGGLCLRRKQDAGRYARIGSGFGMPGS